ncbi:MAG: DUF4259 domain-containing protein [Pseudomonadota bacterium]
MGAWSNTSFGNDTAMDWVVAVSDVQAVAHLLAVARDATRELDADLASEMIAAAELVSAMLGRIVPDMPEEAAELAAKFGSPDDALLRDAVHAVSRARSDSELAELWAEEEDEHAEWLKETDALLARLDPSKPYEQPPQAKEPKLPDDFLGHCMFCYGVVTERDGLEIKVSMGSGIEMSVTPHRACVERELKGPHWNEDSTATDGVLKQLFGEDDEGQ